MPTDIPVPFDAYRDRVRSEWIDHNGHMNMGYYLVVFDFATDEFFRWIGLDEGHRRSARVTTFALEAHVTYHREVRKGDPLRFTTLLIAHDAKKDDNKDEDKDKPDKAKENKGGDDDPGQLLPPPEVEKP